jgi:hypothetical protein
LDNLSRRHRLRISFPTFAEQGQNNMTPGAGSTYLMKIKKKEGPYENQFTNYQRIGATGDL